jgi:hypothetical protein
MIYYSCASFSYKFAMNPPELSGRIKNLLVEGAGHFHMQSFKSPRTEGDELRLSRNTTVKVL